VISPRGKTSGVVVLSMSWLKNDIEAPLSRRGLLYSGFPVGCRRFLAQKPSSARRICESTGSSFRVLQVGLQIEIAVFHDQGDFWRERRKLTIVNLVSKNNVAWIRLTLEWFQVNGPGLTGGKSGKSDEQNIAYQVDARHWVYGTGDRCNCVGNGGFTYRVDASCGFVLCPGQWWRDYLNSLPRRF